MLVILGFAMILVFMALIMTTRLTPMVALILVPTIFGLFAGAGLGMGDMVIDALKGLAPTAALLMLAIMYFGIMIDVGLFDPLIRFIVRFLGDDLSKVVLGTAILAGAVSLDGDGSTTFIITTAALLPIYLRLGMSPVVLTCVAGLVNGTLNIVPWGGPTARAASALKVSPSDIYVPMLPSLVVGLAVAFALVWFLGVRERNRLRTLTLSEPFLTERADTEPRSAGAAASGRRRFTLLGAGPLLRGAQPAPGAHGSVDTTGIVTVRPTPATGTATVEAGTDDRMSGTVLDPNRPTLRPKLIWFT